MVMFALDGCASSGLEFWATEATPAAPAVPAVASRGTPVSPEAAQLLERAPVGARLDYRQPNGAPIDVVLGGPYQSGLQVPCRIGRRGFGSGARSDAVVFCRQGNEWYAMPPVVISGL